MSGENTTRVALGNIQKAQEILADYEAGRPLQAKGDGWLVRFAAHIDQYANDPSLGGSPGLNDREGRSAVMHEASRKDAGSTSPPSPAVRDAKLYSADQQRVANYIAELTGIGGGDDPIGFLIASHAALSAVRDVTLRETLEVLETERQGYENLTHSGDQYCRANNIAKEAALHEALKTLRALSHPSLPDGGKQ